MLAIRHIASEYKSDPRHLFFTRVTDNGSLRSAPSSGTKFRMRRKNGPTHETCIGPEKAGEVSYLSDFNRIICRHRNTRIAGLVVGKAADSDHLRKGARGGLDDDLIEAIPENGQTLIIFVPPEGTVARLLSRT